MKDRFLLDPPNKRSGDRSNTPPASSPYRRLHVGSIDQLAASDGHSSGTSAGGLVHGSSTSASWNH